MKYIKPILETHADGICKWLQMTMGLNPEVKVITFQYSYTTRCVMLTDEEYVLYKLKYGTIYELYNSMAFNSYLLDGR